MRVPMLRVRMQRFKPSWASFTIRTRLRDRPISTSSSGLRHFRIVSTVGAADSGVYLPPRSFPLVHPRHGGLQLTA